MPPQEYIWTLKETRGIRFDTSSTTKPSVHQRHFHDRKAAIDAGRQLIAEAAAAPGLFREPEVIEFGLTERSEFDMGVIDETGASLFVMVTREEVGAMNGEGASEAEVRALIGLGDDREDGVVDEEGSKGTILEDDGGAGATDDEGSEGTILGDDGGAAATDDEGSEGTVLGDDLEELMGLYGL
ncbi:MAG: hypothetical protein Q9212_003549 [Teloschistes hypoglaucus]